MGKTRQTVIGLALAVAIIGAWAALHVYAVFFLRLSWSTAWAILPLAVIETWLGAGMFIVAHDAMHGSLAPGIPALNTWIGRLSLGLYAFFPYPKVAAKHYAHHRLSGRAGDPDFHAERPHAFWPWYARFFRQYFGWPQLAAIFTVVVIYALILHVQILNILLFWALPSIVSSLQLFTFGTWLPHRHKGEDFCDRHNARSLDYGWLLSLATSFHFGYHIEHHGSPQSPWWALPEVRARRLANEAAARTLVCR
jgi:beta-carotene ketolase (CrtW type)